MNAQSNSRAARLMSRLLIAAVTASAGAAFVAVPQASAATVKCGMVVTTSIVLDNDITNCSGDGLVVGASGVEINLNGHTVSGPGTGTTASVGTGRGVFSQGFDNVVVYNGTIANFNTGVSIAGSGGRVLHVHLDHNLKGIVVAAGTGGYANFNTLTGLADGAGGIGINVWAARYGVNGNVVQGFKDMGIYVGDRARDTSMSSNTVTASGYAIFMDGQNTYVNGNTVKSNSWFGITMDVAHCYDSGACYPAATGQVTGNETDLNGFDGIKIGDGWDAVSGVTVGNNTAYSNSGHGINASPGTTDAGGNVAKGNAQNPQCVFVACNS